MEAVNRHRRCLRRTHKQPLARRPMLWTIRGQQERARVILQINTRLYVAMFVSWTILFDRLNGGEALEVMCPLIDVREPRILVTESVMV